MTTPQRSSASGHYLQTVSTEAIRKLLVVDDDEGVYRAVSTVLDKAFGSTIETLYAPDVRKGYSMFFSQAPDLVLLDIHFSPRGSEGIDLLKRVKKVRTNEIMPIVLLSDRTTINVQLTDLNNASSPDDFLSKPLPEAELVAKIRQWDRTISAERKLRKKHGELQRHAHSLARENVESQRLLEQNHHAAALGLFTRGLFESIKDAVLSVSGYSRILQLNFDECDMKTVALAGEKVRNSLSEPTAMLRALSTFFDSPSDRWETISPSETTRWLVTLAAPQLRISGLETDVSVPFEMEAQLIPSAFTSAIISVLLAVRSTAVKGSILSVSSRKNMSALEITFTFEPRAAFAERMERTSNVHDMSAVYAAGIFALRSAHESAKKTGCTVTTGRKHGEMVISISIPPPRDNYVFKELVD